MPRFRSAPEGGHVDRGRTQPPSVDRLRQLLPDLIHPAHFYLRAELRLESAHEPAEDVAWEVFQGRLLDAKQTRCRRTFESWSLFLVDGSGRSSEPIISLKLDIGANHLHVTRAILSYVWEAYDGGENTVLSQETTRWIVELVGTVDLRLFAGEDDLRDEIVCRIFQAVVGTSRLPLTSQEAPLPAFSLGEMAYFYRSAPGSAGPDLGPVRTWQDLIDTMWQADLTWLEHVKLFETLFHATPFEDLGDAGERVMERLGPGTRPTDLLQAVLNEASLSPYTDLVDKSLAFLDALAHRGNVSSGEHADFLGRLLRQVGRHLTAYDLVTFHHRGANYPDALLLDALLKAYLQIANRLPLLFQRAAGDSPAELKSKRLRRRALRQAVLLRRRYEGHLVPEVPTSPGENSRVMPSPHVRIPEEQILNPNRRDKKLYDGDPLDGYLGSAGHAILRESIADLEQPDELRELGMAIFLDRPLGAGKARVEPDHTPLFSYLAFSRTLALSRLSSFRNTLGLIPDRATFEALISRMEQGLEVHGLPVTAISSTSRPGRVSLADAGRVADDFLIMHTTARTVEELFRLYDLEEVNARFFRSGLKGPLLVVRVPAPDGAMTWTLAVYDSELRRRLELQCDFRAGYFSRAGTELPVNPLQLIRAWTARDGEPALVLHDLTATPIDVYPTAGT